MESRINKPRVFLSHSSLDRIFIDKLYDDLRKCQIDPWKDTEEIRDGKPWLKVIFQDGIPACDVVLVYLTENSIKSQTVEKEIDAALINQLQGSGISFIPYVGSAGLRNNLRLDLRSLHCREWNETNYYTILPSVVAEIWHSYLDRVVSTAVLQERNRRLELELELSRIKQARQESAFSTPEDKDFSYIYSTLSRQVEVKCDLLSKNLDEANSRQTKIAQHTFRIRLIDLVMYYHSQKYLSVDPYSLLSEFTKVLNTHGYPEKQPRTERHYGNVTIDVNIVLELQTYGLLTRGRASTAGAQTRLYYDYTDKMFRFRYWLGYNNLLTDNLLKEFYLEPVIYDESNFETSI